MIFVCKTPVHPVFYLFFNTGQSRASPLQDTPKFVGLFPPKIPPRSYFPHICVVE